MSIESDKRGVKKIYSSVPIECICDLTKGTYYFREYRHFDGDKYAEITMKNFDVPRDYLWSVINGSNFPFQRRNFSD